MSPRLGLIKDRSAGCQIDDAEVHLRLNISLCCGGFKVGHPKIDILINPDPLQQKDANIELGRRMSAICRKPIKGCGFGNILFDTQTGFIGNAEIKLRKGMPLISGTPEPFCRFDRIIMRRSRLNEVMAKLIFAVTVALFGGFSIQRQSLL